MRELVKPQLHPPVWRELRQLVELYGSQQISTAVFWIEKEHHDLQLRLMRQRATREAVRAAFIGD